ncbi:MAG: hypothetical protein ABS955_11045, partial [Stenotrophomonas maltophilia]
MSRLHPAARGMTLVPPQQVTLQGVLGDALAANRSGRLSTFVVDEHSAPISIFSQVQKDQNHEGDWYGEHAGKWLSATARAVAQGGRPQLEASLRPLMEAEVFSASAEAVVP